MMQIPTPYMQLLIVETILIIEMNLQFLLELITLIMVNDTNLYQTQQLQG